jgi:hypothetical protein
LGPTVSPEGVPETTSPGVIVGVSVWGVASKTTGVTERVGVDERVACAISVAGVPVNSDRADGAIRSAVGC